jgi:Ring finger domain
MVPPRYPTAAPVLAPVSSTGNNSGESVALFAVVALFGIVFLLLGMAVWRWYPSALEEGGGDGGTAAPETASSRLELERARLEYVHKVLKTRSWHGASRFSESGTSVPRADAPRPCIAAAALTVSRGDGDGRGDVEVSSATAPHHQDPQRLSDQESGMPTTESPVPRVPNEAATRPPAPPVTPCGSSDAEHVSSDDEVDKDLRADNDEFGDSDEAPECAICLCPFKEHDTVCESSNHTCTHLYHPRCLEPWLVLHEQCPVCREAYLAGARPLRCGKRWRSCGGRDSARR